MFNAFVLIIKAEIAKNYFQIVLSNTLDRRDSASWKDKNPIDMQSLNP